MNRRSASARSLSAAASPEPDDYARLSKAELVQRLRTLEQSNDPLEGSSTDLKHKLQAHQIELEMQNRELRDSQHELEASRDRYLELYDFAPIPYFNLDEHSTICAMNLAAAEFLGGDRSRFVGGRFTAFLEPESAHALRELLKRCVVESHVPLSTELRIRGGDRWVPVRLTAVFNENLSAPNGVFLVTLLDLTDRLKAEEMERNYTRELERQVVERTAALKESNTELELFTVSVAHDLRMPARTMQAFTEILLEESRDKLSPMSVDYAQRVVNNARRLDLLLENLLEYSRVSRGEMHLEAIDLRDLAEEVVKAQNSALMEQRGEVRMEGPALSVLAHRSMLGQVLWNLLENARKFVAPGVVPKIVIRLEPSGQFARVWVEDNGIGISPLYHRKIFSIFERVHEGSYEGSGVGLAVAARAISRMNGRIGLESQANQGSKFWIELPLAPVVPAAPSVARKVI